MGTFLTWMLLYAADRRLETQALCHQIALDMMFDDAEQTDWYRAEAGANFNAWARHYYEGLL